MSCRRPELPALRSRIPLNSPDGVVRTRSGPAPTAPEQVQDLLCCCRCTTGMERALTTISLLLALLLTGAGTDRADRLPGTGAGAPQAVTAQSLAAAAAFVPAAPVPSLAIAERNAGPTGPGGARAGAVPTGDQRHSEVAGLDTSLEAFGHARLTYLGHYLAGALTRAGIPVRHTTAPPHFHTV